jgi:hypothetical protein
LLGAYQLPPLALKIKLWFIDASLASTHTV